MKSLLVILFFFLSFFKVLSSENIVDIKNLLEGRYELVYWTENKIQYDYPEVAGVLVINNNNALITMDKNMNSNKSVELIGWGRYDINSYSFHIGWHDWKLLLIENNIKSVKKKSPWKGMREYSVSIKGDKLLVLFFYK